MDKVSLTTIAFDLSSEKYQALLANSQVVFCEGQSTIVPANEFSGKNLY